LGRLLDVTNDRIALDQDGRRVEIPFAVIEKSNYEHDWSAEYAAGSK
jgi:ribosome maturation factor RimP